MQALLSSKSTRQGPELRPPSSHGPLSSRPRLDLLRVTEGGGFWVCGGIGGSEASEAGLSGGVSAEQALEPAVSPSLRIARVSDRRRGSEGTRTRAHTRRSAASAVAAASTVRVPPATLNPTLQLRLMD